MRGCDNGCDCEWECECDGLCCDGRPLVLTPLCGAPGGGGKVVVFVKECADTGVGGAGDDARGGRWSRAAAVEVTGPLADGDGAEEGWAVWV